MHFAIDVREACRTQRTGKGQWVYGFVNELCTRNCDFTLLTDAPPPPHWVEAAREVRVFPSGIRWHLRAARFLRNNPAVDFYLSPTSFIVPCLLGSKANVIPVIHDLIAFRDDPHAVKAKYIERLTLRRTLRTSRHVVAISNATKQDLLQQYSFLQSDAITVVYAGPLRQQMKTNQSDNTTILCPATLCPRKNQKRLIQAYRLLPEPLRQQYQLLLVGARGWHDQDIIHLAEETPGVTWLNYVTDEKYESLLQTSHVLALPSLYEGFGMQVLDALQSGLPVLTTERGSLHEVVGNCAVLVQPEIVEDIARGLIEILTKTDVRQRLHEQGPAQAAQFTWQKSVDTFLQATAKMPW